MYSWLEAREILLSAGYSPDKVETFLVAHTESPDVWQAFENIALTLIIKGKKAGAIDILGRARWETQIEGGREWKVNNNYAPYYARIFAAKYPEHKSFFEFRTIRRSDV